MQTERLLNINYGDHSIDGMDLLYKQERQMPDTVDVAIYRYNASDITENRPDHGLINYYNSNTPSRQNRSLNLKFCLYGNCFCPKDCTNCTSKEECTTIDLFEFRFNPFFLKKMVPATETLSKREKVLSFKYPKSFTKNIPVGEKKRTLLNSLLEFKGYGDSLDNILIHAKVNELLLYSMEALQEDQDDVPACPLSIEADFVNRLFDAKQLLLENLSTPLTIKELSKKVAMNECYLKKGFKDLFGATIFEFYQKERMAHAKYLLYDKGLTVTEVSDLLGYSSISHFSTAFKKFTGLRPCELLFKQ
ncbi:MULTISPECIES: helix-turn-helix domain-containing protein [Chitinophagaceae]